MNEVPFGRKGTYMFLSQGPMGMEHFGKSDLWLCTNRASFSASFAFYDNRMMSIHLLNRDGVRIPYAVDVKPAELSLVSDYGTVRFCFAEPSLLRVHSDDGLGISIDCAFTQFHSMAKNMLDGSWQIVTNDTRVNILLVPMAGTLKVNAPYDWRTMKTVAFHGDFLADETGKLDVAIEEFEYEPTRRAVYPDYEAGVKAVEAEFNRYVEQCIPELPPEFESRRLQAAWTIWTHTRVPTRFGKIKREMITMNSEMFNAVFGWQQPFQAMAHCKNEDFSWDLLQSMFDFQIPETGQLPDHVDDGTVSYQAFKPPIQGVALNWLLRKGKFRSISRERKQLLYDELALYLDFFFKFRDLDHDGLVEYHHCDESGTDESPIFSTGLPVCTPDVNAYMVGILDALTLLGRELGKEEEAARYAAQADELTARVVKKLWNGERFIGFNCATGEPVLSKSIHFYDALLMGKHLPQEIIDKVCADLFTDGVMMTPYGVPSEALDSVFFEHRWSRGTIQAPTNCLLIMALSLCGKEDLARDLARRYCLNLTKNGLYHMHDPITGLGISKAIGVKTVQHWAAWSAGIYLMLVDQFCR